MVDSAIEALKKEGIQKIALVVYRKNKKGNRFWEKRGFSRRKDLVYRNKTITEQECVKAKEAGMDEHLVKPVEIAKILNVMKKYMIN